MLAALFLLVRWQNARLLFGLALVVAMGGLRFALTPASTLVAAYNGHGGITLEGVVANDPTPRGSGIRFILNAEAATRAGQTHATSGLVLIDAPFGYPVASGERIRATGDIYHPPSFDTFSYADFLARSGVFSQMPNAAIEVIAANPNANPLQTALIDLRHQASLRIDHALPEPYAGLLNGTLLGDESSIAPDIEDAYAVTGAAHVIAISGYNMVVISGILLAILGKTRLPSTTQAWIVLAIIALYTVLVGASASIVRAALMSGLLIVGERIIRRRTFVPASLAFATLVMALHNPYVLWDVGFQLSLFATLGIVLFARPLTQWARRALERRVSPSRAETTASVLEAGLFVSIAAQAFTLPLIALYFERLSLVSLPVNFLIAPVQPFIMILGGAAVLLSFISTALAQPIFLATLLPMAWTTQIVRQAAALPFAEVVVHVPPNATAAFFGVIVGGAMLHATQPDSLLRAVTFVRSRPLFVGTCAAAVGVLVFLVALILSRPDGRLHLWLLNMGHSHAVLIQSPQGTQALIDGGRFPSRLLLALGDRLPFNDRWLEAVVITQPDEFDYSALPEVFGRYTPQVIVSNGQDNPGRSYTTLRDSWGSTPVVAVTAGYTIQLGEEARLEVLYPQIMPRETTRMNDGTLMLRLTYRDFSLLIPGDASQTAQTEVVASGMTLQSDALILPQRGTVASLDDNFLAAVSPEFALLQLDPANRLGDPNEDTLAKLGNLPLYRTDEGGTIHLVTDGQTYQISYQG
jgi:competence protein ComEC